LQAKLGGLVDTVVLDNSYHIVTLDQQRHIVAERSERFVKWVESTVADRQVAAPAATTPARGAAIE
jgi:carboxylesterase